MDEKILKTITLCDEWDSPNITILPGHHTPKIFNEAFIAEGWEADAWPSDYISHEYWVRHPDGKWTCSNKSDPNAMAVTVADWSGPRDVGPDPSFH